MADDLAAQEVVEARSEEQGWLTGPMILALLAMVLGIVLITNDVSALNVSLPAIEATFDADITTILWVVNAYSLVFAVLVIPGGRMADMFGRRRIFFIGAVVFALFSLVGGLSPNIWVLIGARTLMGVGGAMMWPAILGMAFAIVPREKAGFAGALITAGAGLGVGIGPLLGGTLTDFLSWRWILYLNFPLAVLTILVIWTVVPADVVAKEHERLDYAGVVAIALGIFALLFALDQVADRGWGDPIVIVCLASSVVLLVAFIFIERHAGEQALIPWSIMRNREFRSACFAIALIAPMVLVPIFYLPQFMQKMLDFSAFEAGVGLLPRIIPFILISFITAAIYDKVGPKITVTAGAAILICGGLLLSVIPNEAGYFWLMPGMIVIGIGVGVFFTAAKTAVITSLDQSQASLGGGILYMFNLAGGSIGLAISTTIFATRSSSDIGEQATELGVTLTDSEQSAILGVLVGTDSSTAILARFDSQTANQLIEITRDAFIDAFTYAMTFNVVLACVGFLIILFYVGGPLHIGSVASSTTAFRENVARHMHRLHG